MSEISDTYKTITDPSPQVVFKDRKSKFFGYAFPLQDENKVKTIIHSLKKKHPSADHFCYAWQLGAQQPTYRANDDGEPNNSAGMPIYGQLKSFDVTNVLVVVVRLFGGTKLGVSGLINAYKNTAQMALEASVIDEKVIDVKFELHFGYNLTNDVMRLLKRENIRIVSQEMTVTCTMVVTVPQSRKDKVEKELKRVHRLQFTML